MIKYYGAQHLRIGYVEFVATNIIGALHLLFHLDCWQLQILRCAAPLVSP